MKIISLYYYKQLFHFNQIIPHYNCKFYSTQTILKKNYFPLIGLEIHAQLAVQNKLFTNVPYNFGAPPNTQLGLHDVAIPGSMPILNRRCLELAIVASIGLNCHINFMSRFDRKHYFYADLPAGYQITQYYEPISKNGYFDYIWLRNISTVQQQQQQPVPLYTEIIRNDDVEDQCYYRSRARIKRIQIEQDSGKSLHHIQNDNSLIDLNRSDVGLIEIVTEPDFNSSDQTAAFLTDLSRLLKHLKCCSAIGAFGELRVDVNVSIGQDVANQNARVEIKNINSIRGVMCSIDYEIKRQSEILDSGGQITHETRSYDAVNNVTLRMRDKELTQDYRYIPEPNLPSIKLLSTCSLCSSHSSSSSPSSSASSTSSPSPSPSFPTSSSPPSPPPPSSSNNPICIQCIKQKYHVNSINWHTSLPHYKKQLFLIDHSLPIDRVLVLIDNTDLCALYELTLKYLIDTYSNLANNEQFNAVSYAKELSYWICGHIHGCNKNGALKSLPHVNQLAEFVQMNLTGHIFGPRASKLLNLIIQMTDQQADHQLSIYQLAREHNLLLICDINQIKIQCEKLIHDQPKLVQQYIDGMNKKKSLKKLIAHLLARSDYYENSRKFNISIVEKILKQLMLHESSSSSSSSPSSPSSLSTSNSSIINA
ncbi:unnamed protein product [Schistosoma turkestanicum]|nr:unnamed protein product [Schistosoma turkestanicum]